MLELYRTLKDFPCASAWPPAAACAHRPRCSRFAAESQADSGAAAISAFNEASREWIRGAPRPALADRPLAPLMPRPGSFFSERLRKESLTWRALKGFLFSTFPILAWAPRYRWPELRGDLLAGLTVAAMLIPQGMSYALLAGLPPYYGLFAGLVPMVLYSFFGACRRGTGSQAPYGILGTSRELSIGPAAMVSLTIPSAIAGLLPPTSDPSYQDVYNSLARTLVALHCYRIAHAR